MPASSLSLEALAVRRGISVWRRVNSTGVSEDKMKPPVAMVVISSAVVSLYPSSGFSQQQQIGSVTSPAAATTTNTSSRQTQPFSPFLPPPTATIRVTGRLPKAFTSIVRWRTSCSRPRCSSWLACCSAVLTDTNRIVGRPTASQIASASAASCLSRIHRIMY